MALFGGPTFQLTGDKHVDRLFRTLPVRVQKKVLRKPLRDAVKLIKPAVEAKTPVDKGRLKKSYKVRAGKRSRRNRNQVNVVLLTGKEMFQGDQFYGAFQELGFRLGRRPRRGRPDRRRKIRGLHFMKRGMESQRAAAQAIAIRGIADGIIKEALHG